MTETTLDAAADEVMTNAQYALLRSQQSLLAFLEDNPQARAFAEAQLLLWRDVASRLSAGAAAMLVTHGANIELPAVELARLVGAALDPFPLGHGEGIRVRYERGKAISVRRLSAS